MLHTRPARPEDARAIALIYNEGIAERVATFETRLRTAEDVLVWIEGRHPCVVVEVEGEDPDSDVRQVLAFAATSAYRSRPCYAGVAEFSVYVARRARRRGAGRTAMLALCEAAEKAGFWKLLSRVFPENQASCQLLRSLGFREVGRYEKHGKLDGQWRDTIIFERLLDGEG